MKDYKAVGAKVLLKALPPVQETVIGNIIIPEKAAKAAAATVTPIVELEILAVGPDCKVAKPGDFAVVNINGLPSALPLNPKLSVHSVPETELIAVRPC